MMILFLKEGINGNCNMPIMPAITKAITNSEKYHFLRPKKVIIITQKETINSGIKIFEPQENEQ